MSEELILKRFDQMERMIARIMGERLTREEMAARLRISGKTLTLRVRERLVPSPGVDGKWLLSEVLEWESETARNV